MRVTAAQKKSAAGGPRSARQRDLLTGHMANRMIRVRSTGVRGNLRFLHR